MEAAKKLPVDWNNYQITRNDQYTSSMLNAARGVRSMMLSALIGAMPWRHFLSVNSATFGESKRLQRAALLPMPCFRNYSAEPATSDELDRLLNLNESVIWR